MYFFFGISDHKPILFPCNKSFSDDFNKSDKASKWSTHICNTKRSSILSHNYFSVLADELETKSNILTADDMVDKFLNTSEKIGKDINVFVPSKLSSSAFHCPYYIKKLSHEKPFSNCANIDEYIDQFNKLHKLCKTLKKVKSKFRSKRYKANIFNIGNIFLNKEYRKGWNSLRKISKPSYSSSAPATIKSKEGFEILSPSKQLKRWAEHYNDLASETNGHSLDREYWNYKFKSDFLEH
ncbi:hypothetical protein PIROE2DRAFT_16799 [Piromyces sp. E2]|nr:hypothetical protein PIROE2DRAFT_16799 [Piromyces sp. E2]|eukprot:OUM58039.1 hypothetical protein PIROE2DRAFT_16799 [Piromyces sp. E2]